MWLCSALLASNLEKRSNLGEGDLWAAGGTGRSLAGLMGQGRGIELSLWRSCLGIQHRA